MPLALVVTAIVPIHTPEAFSFIHHVIALVPVARLPLENTIAVLHVVFEVALKLVAVFSLIFLPFSSSFFQTVGEISDIGSSLRPLIRAETARPAIRVLTCV